MAEQADIVDINKALKYHNEGKLEKAQEIYNEVLNKSPGNHQVVSFLAKSYSQQGKFDRAAILYEKAINIYPEDKEYYIEYGSSLRKLRRYEDSAAIFGLAIKKWPDFDKAYCELGTSMEGLGKTDMAFYAYQKAIDLNPSYARAYNNLGCVLKKHGKFEESVEAFSRAIEINPSYAIAIMNLGSAYVTLNRHDYAEKYFKDAADISPADKNPFYNLAALYELQNKLEKAEDMAIRITSIDENDVFANIILAKCEARNKKVKDALSRLEKLDATTASHEIKIRFYFEIASLYNKSHKYENAYVNFEKGNSIVQKYNETVYLQRKKYSGMVDDIKNALLREKINEWPELSNNSGEKQPVFLVGFPRSGTTLLNQMLDSHPDIQTLEEEEIMSRVLHTMDTIPVDLSSIDTKIQKKLQKLYYTEVKKVIKYDKSKILVDKMPLNIIHIGIISRIFPNARFILAMRHPCDSCLSCFMQNFDLNLPMSNFTSLEDTVEVYDKVMELWQHYIDMLDIKYHVIRYEDVVEDFSSELKKLLNFLGMEWNPKVEDYYKHIRKDSKINTPSYSQVTEKIYKSAKYRWLNYDKYLEPYLPRIQKYIECFGYADKD